jgi:hypothetical protein
MRYLVNERDMTPEESLAAYRSVVKWTGSRGNRFSLRIEPDRYDDPTEYARFLELGTHLPEGRRQAGTIEVEGTLSKELVEELTRSTAPARAVSGDVSPVEKAMIFAGDRPIYGSFDYGRTQVLDITLEELENLRLVLKQAGLDPAILVPAPPYVTSA